MLHYKTGRKPTVHTDRRMRSKLAFGAAMNALGPPPAGTGWRTAVRNQIGLDWGMDGNDQYGCCVWADEDHQDILRVANLGGRIAPEDQRTARVLANYTAVTGFRVNPDGTVVNDDGTDENAALAWLKAQRTIADYAAVDHTNLDHVKWAIALCGAVRLGVLVNAAYEQAFEARQPWDRDLGGDEGHDICLVDYDASGFWACTWARDDQLVAPSLLQDPRFCAEAHVELAYDWMSAAGTAPDGLSLDQLDQDMRAVGEEDAAYLPNVITDGGALEAARHGVARSHHWPTVEHEAKVAHPACHGCGEVGSIQVHHRFAFHEDILAGRADVELTPSNFRNLCQSETKVPNNECHLAKGHLDDFKSWNPNLDADLARWQGRSLADLKSDADWQAAHAARAKPWDEWTRDEKIAYRQLLDQTFPLDGDEAKAVVARFPDAAPVPYDEWLAKLPS